MNNPFGLPDDLFGAILASAIAEGMNPANNRTMKKPNPEASKPGSIQTERYTGRWCKGCKENL